MRVVAQHLGSDELYQQVLLDLLNNPKIVKCKALVAFATLDGLVRIGAEPGGILNTFISDKAKELQWIIGIDSVTTAEALSCLKLLQDNSEGNCLMRAFSSNSGSLFHPKLYIFEEANGCGYVLIGSNNLTPGGLENNAEVAVLLGELTADECNQWLEVWDIACGLHENIFEIDDELIGRIRDERKRDVRRRRRIITHKEEEPEPLGAETRVFIRYIARAGGRTSQVHFSLGKVREFFQLEPGDATEISLQMVQPGMPLGRIEKGRRLVFSQVNRNAKIEMEGLKNVLPRDYPAGGRAILLVQEIESNHYRYMVMLPGDSGYDELNEHLELIPQQGQALKEDILTLERLIEVWPDYPI